MLIPFDQYGPQLAAFVLLPILLLMLAISYMLYRVRKKKSYLSLSLALVLSLAAAAGGLVEPVHLPAWFPQALTGAELAGSVLIVFGLYQLYRVVPSFVKGIFYVLCIGAAALPFVTESWIASSATAAFFILAAVLLTGRIGGADRKFPAAMAVSAAGAIAQLLPHFFPSPALAKWSAYAVHWLPVIAYLILFFVLVNRLLDIVQQSYLSSITDPLTGLFNRRYFNAYVGRYLNNGVAVSVLFSDIDNFKKLNDTQGHKAGDEALKRVASLLRSEAQGIGIAGRYGGEEMVLCVTDPNVNMRTFAEQIRQRIEEDTGVTASIGCSTATCRIQADELIKQADEAMYQAKQTGKNKVVHHSA